MGILRPFTKKNVLLLYLLVIFSATVIRGWNNHISLNTWNIGDWLINYQGGFVRRGLFGELALLAHNFFGFDIVIFVFACQILFYFGFMSFCFLLLTRQEIHESYSFLIYSPFIFSFQVFDPHGGFRKEIIAFFLLSLVYWSASLNERVFKKVFYFSLLIYPLAVLTHEMLIVLLPYLIICYVIGRNNINIREILCISIFLLPTILAFASALLVPVDGQTIEEICRSLGQMSSKICVENGAIMWLDMPMSDLMRWVWRKITQGGYTSVYPIYTTLVVLGFLPFANRISAILKYKKAVYLLVLSFCMTIVLTIVMLDWGRLIYIQAVSIFILCIGFGARRDAGVVGEIGTPLLRINVNKNVGKSITLLLFLMYVSVWNVMNSGNTIGSGIVGLLFEVKVNF